MKLNNKYSIKFKLKYLELVKILGIYRTSIIIGINRKSIREWYLNSQKYVDIKKKILYIDYQGMEQKKNFIKQKMKLLFLLSNVKK